MSEYGGGLGRTGKYVEVLGVNITVLGKVEVLLSDENALCGDRVSACPYNAAELRRDQLFHSHGNNGEY
jgi:hypothetical protein